MAEVVGFAAPKVPLTLDHAVTGNIDRMVEIAVRQGETGARRRRLELAAGVDGHAWVPASRRGPRGRPT